MPSGFPGLTTMATTESVTIPFSALTASRRPLPGHEASVDQEGRSGLGEVHDVGGLAGDHVVGLGRGGAEGVVEHDVLSRGGVREGRLEGRVGIRDDRVADDVHGLRRRSLGVGCEEVIGKIATASAAIRFKLAFFIRGSFIYTLFTSELVENREQDIGLVVNESSQGGRILKLRTHARRRTTPAFRHV